MDPPRAVGLWTAWVGANALGEGAGLGLAFVVGAAVHAWLGESPAFLLAVLALGTLEGVILGGLQGLVLRRALPSVRPGRWVIATALGALVAWTLGTLPSTLMDLGADAASGPPPEPPSDAVQYAAAAVMGAVAGPVLAVFQWRVLRAPVRRAWRWIPAHAVAWALAMPITFVVGGRVPRDGLTPGFALEAVALLTAMGALVGAVHGLALVRFVTEASPAHGGAGGPR